MYFLKVYENINTKKIDIDSILHGIMFESV